MITAERFATTNGSYWSRVLPRLEHFVRISNMGPRRFDPPLHLDLSPERQALVSETGFLLWAHQEDPAHLKSEDVESARSRALQRLAELDVTDDLALPLSLTEQQAVRELASSLWSYCSSEQLTRLEIEPQLPGCGAISGGIPDLIALRRSWGADDIAIIEVKAVDRTFRSSDFRQLVVYAALYFAANTTIPDILGVVNPLRGTALEVGTEEFFQDVTGASAGEVIQDLVIEWSSVGVSS